MLSWLMPCRPSLLSLPTDNDLVSVTGWQIRLHLNSFPAPRCYVLSSALVPPPTVWQVSGCDDDKVSKSMPCSLILLFKIAMLLHMEILQHFSDQREADLAAHLTPRQFPQMTKSSSDTSGLDTSSAKTIGHILTEINFLNHSGVLILPLVLKRSCRWLFKYSLSFSSWKGTHVTSPYNKV